MKKLLIIPMLFACYMVMGQDASKIIGTPYQLNGIEVARNDFPNKQNWSDAKAKCNKLGEGWRLPTQDESIILYQNAAKIGGFEDNNPYDSEYWSSKEYGTNAGSRNMFSGGITFGSKRDTYNVRAVRTK